MRGGSNADRVVVVVVVVVEEEEEELNRRVAPLE
jgi:hypothetical protein